MNGVWDWSCCAAAGMYVAAQKAAEARGSIRRNFMKFSRMC
jgi:hypothetical protein